MDTPESLGHWEMDCVVGQKTDKQVLLVLMERILPKYSNTAKAMLPEVVLRSPDCISIFY